MKIKTRTDSSSLSDQILNSWRIHNDINLLLIGKISIAGFDAVPALSRGRSVREQFVHMHRNRLGWLHYHLTGKRASRSLGKLKDPSRSELKRAFILSGKKVGLFMEKAIRGEIAPRAFKKEGLRWMSYLISHESHHRGQILLALKQNGMRQPESLALNGVWGKWIWGK